MSTQCNWNTYGPLGVSAFGVMPPPGVLISCALVALPPGVLKLALRFTVLPLAPLGAGRCGVPGTSPSSLSPVSSGIYSGHDCFERTWHTCPHPSLLVLADPAWVHFFAVPSLCFRVPMHLVWFS